MTELELARKCGQSFALGMAFMYGYLHAKRGMARDADGIKFRKTDNNQTIAIRNGKVVGGAGISVGPDHLPTFDAFRRDASNSSLGYHKAVRRYMQTHFKAIEGCENLKGLPGCKKLIFSTNGIKETAARMNPSKEKMLPFIPYVYRTGEPLGDPQPDKKGANAMIHFTAKIIRYGHHFYAVKLISKQAGSVAEFSHYAVDKVDDLCKRHKGDAVRAFRDWAAHEKTLRPRGY